MTIETASYSLPRWRLARWLVATGRPVPDPIRSDLIAHLFGTLPIFLGGTINSVVIALLVASSHPSPVLVAWCTTEVVLSAVRIAIMLHANRAARLGRPTYTDLNIILSVTWGFTTGLGACLTLLTGDWPVAIVACISAAGMVGGMCFRYVSAPRLATAVIAGALLPATVGALFSDNPVLLIAAAQAPTLLVAMAGAAFRLNRMMVSTMIAQLESNHRAHHDDLTGLANRAELTRGIEARLAAAAASGRSFALFYLDLDGFKAVNDSYGHGAGDAVLKRVAGRIKAVLREGDLGARLGGDEFVVLTDHVDEDAARAFGRMLVSEISRNDDVGEVGCPVGVSIGIALAPRHGADAIRLLAAADDALYAAKTGGRGRVAFAGSAEPRGDAGRLPHVPDQQNHPRLHDAA